MSSTNEWMKANIRFSLPLLYHQTPGVNLQPLYRKRNLDTSEANDTAVESEKLMITAFVLMPDVTDLPSIDGGSTIINRL